MNKLTTKRIFQLGILVICIIGFAVIIRFVTRAFRNKCPGNYVFSSTYKKCIPSCPSDSTYVEANDQCECNKSQHEINNGICTLSCPPGEEACDDICIDKDIQTCINGIPCFNNNIIDGKCCIGGKSADGKKCKECTVPCVDVCCGDNQECCPDCTTGKCCTGKVNKEGTACCKKLDIHKECCGFADGVSPANMFSDNTGCYQLCGGIDGRGGVKCYTPGKKERCVNNNGTYTCEPIKSANCQKEFTNIQYDPPQISGINGPVCKTSAGQSVWCNDGNTPSTMSFKLKMSQKCTIDDCIAIANETIGKGQDIDWITKKQLNDRTKYSIADGMCTISFNCPNDGILPKCSNDQKCPLSPTTRCGGPKNEKVCPINTTWYTEPEDPEGPKSGCATEDVALVLDQQSGFGWNSTTKCKPIIVNAEQQKTINGNPIDGTIKTCSESSTWTDVSDVCKFGPNGPKFSTIKDTCYPKILMDESTKSALDTNLEWLCVPWPGKYPRCIPVPKGTPNATTYEKCQAGCTFGTPFNRFPIQGYGGGVRGCRNFSASKQGQCIPCTQSCDESLGCMLVPSYQLYDTNRFGANANFNKYKGLFTHTNNVTDSTPIPISETDISDTDKGYGPDGPNGLEYPNYLWLNQDNEEGRNETNPGGDYYGTRSIMCNINPVQNGTDGCTANPKTSPKGGCPGVGYTTTCGQKGQTIVNPNPNSPLQNPGLPQNDPTLLPSFLSNYYQGKRPVEEVTPSSNLGWPYQIKYTRNTVKNGHVVGYGSNTCQSYPKQIKK